MLVEHGKSGCAPPDPLDGLFCMEGAARGGGSMAIDEYGAQQAVNEHYIM